MKHQLSSTVIIESTKSGSFSISLSAGSYYAIFLCGKTAQFIATNNIKFDGSDHAIFLCDKNLNRGIKNRTASCPSTSH